jgi:hypothetical protein
MGEVVEKCGRCGEVAWHEAIPVFVVGCEGVEFVPGLRGQRFRQRRGRGYIDQGFG